MDIEIELLPPACPIGYTDPQLLEMLGVNRFNAFKLWMRGQTYSSCDGRAYNYELKQYEPTVCLDNPHGIVYYVDDVRRWFRADRIID